MNITAVQYLEARERARAFVKMARQDPRFMTEVREKLAANPAVEPSAFERFTSYFDPSYLAAAATMAGATAAGNFAVNRIRESVQKRHGYQNMLKVNPDLREEDATQTQLAYNTLFRVNPQFAQDPLVSGQFVRNHVSSEGMDLGSIVNMSRSRPPDANLSGFLASGKGLMAGGPGGSPLEQKAKDRTKEKLEELQKMLVSKQRYIDNMERKHGM